MYWRAKHSRIQRSKLEESLTHESSATIVPSLQQGQAKLKQIFGYDAFRDGQWEVIEQVLKGKDALILLPTGGGKSLCYQLPALMMDGLTLVISPLISLMQDQVQQLNTQGVDAAYLNSSLSSEQQQSIMQQVQAGVIRILYVAPERVLQSYFISQLQHQQLALIAVDEAHCVSHWGHDFREDYRRLGELKHKFPQVPMMALTATADYATQMDIQHQLSLNTPHVHRGGFDRPNIQYNLLAKYKGYEQVLKFVKQQKDHAGIVYCSSRRKVDELAHKLSQSGVSAGAYHAGLESSEREFVQTAFLKDDLQVVVATVAFGMGINKSNVRYVIHHDVPRSVEAYYQETGRAGRDGLPAQALLLYDEKDAATVKKWITEGSQQDRLSIEMQKFEAMESFAEAQTCRRLVLLNYFADYRTSPCGNCDICLDPPTMFDATVQTQMILSCILRLAQDTHTQYVIDVLRGLTHRKIIDNQHDQLSTYGLGKSEPATYWHNLIQQLIHRGLLRIDMTQQGILRINEIARNVLKGKQNIMLAVPKLSVKTTKTDKLLPSNVDKRLLSKLKHLRKQIAEEDKVPAFVVFSDASLVDMCHLLPTDRSSFMSVSGVGERKLSRYGDAFTNLISSYLAANQN